MLEPGISDIIEGEIKGVISLSLRLETYSSLW